MTRTFSRTALTTLIVSCNYLFCGPVDDARQLQNEAQDILRASSGSVADPKVYADAVRKLQKAQALLEQATKSGAGDDALEQSVSASLFWARRFCNMDVLRELDKGGTAQISKPVDPNAAETAFKKAEEFEQTHKDDDYAVALRWFKFSSDFSGTDWSLRAIARARAAQARHQALTAKKVSPSDQTEFQKLISAGELLFQLKKYDEALVQFMAAKKVEDKLPASRGIGNTYIELGHLARDEYAAEYLPLARQYQQAVAKKDKAAAIRLSQEGKELVARLKPLEQKAVKYYEQAQAEFQHGLDLAKGKDLECEAQIALTYFERGHEYSGQAKARIGDVIAKYNPANDEERTIYEYIRSLLKLLK